MGDAASDGAEGAAPGDVPRPVLIACVILALESLALLGAAVVLIAKTFGGTPGDVGRALFTAAFAVLGAVVLGLGARALMRLQAGARTPIVVMQLLAIPVSYTLAFQAERPAYGGPILFAALAVLYLLFTPPARAALDREPPR